MNTVEFITKASIKHSNLYTYQNTVYTTTKTKVIITCNKHGDFLMTPNNHLTGQGCPECGGTKKHTTSSFISKALSIHGDTYDYSLTSYKNMKTSVDVICKHHGLITVHPDAHLRGAGCNKCAETAKGEALKFTTEEFIQQATLRHSGRYIYNNTTYNGIHNKLTITCPIHGDFEQIANSHLRGNGCKHCAESSACYTDFPTTLYYIKLEQNGTSLYKVGITSKTVSERFSKELKLGMSITTIISYTFSSGRPAFLLEQHILKTTYEHKYQGIPFLLNGIGDTELRTKDIATIITDLYLQHKGTSC